MHTHTVSTPSDHADTQSLLVVPGWLDQLLVVLDLERIQTFLGHIKGHFRAHHCEPDVHVALVGFFVEQSFEHPLWVHELFVHPVKFEGDLVPV